MSWNWNWNIMLDHLHNKLWFSHERLLLHFHTDKNYRYCVLFWICGMLYSGCFFCFVFFSNLIVSKYKHTFSSKHRNSFDKAQGRPEQTAEEKVKLIHTTQVLVPSCWSLFISDYSSHPWRPFLPSGSADGIVSVLLLRWGILGHTHSPSVQPPEAHLPPGLGVAPQK